MQKLSLFLLLFVFTGCNPHKFGNVPGFVEYPPVGTAVKLLTDVYCDGHRFTNGTVTLVTYNPFAYPTQIKVLKSNNQPIEFLVERSWFEIVQLDNTSQAELIQKLNK